MLNVTLLSWGRGNIFEYLKCGEYYRGKDGEQRSNSRWYGAEELGLDGSVDLRDFETLADGFAPDAKALDNRGEALCRNAGDRGETKVRRDKHGIVRRDEHGKTMTVTRGGHRIGFDCTFSGDKTYDLLFAAADDEEREVLLDMFHQSVNNTIDVIRGTLQTRRGHSGGESIGIESIPAASFTHFGNRELEPKVHEHAILFGVCKGEDGKWATWDAIELKRHQQMFGALFRAQLCRRLQEHGYGIEQHREVDADGRETGQVYGRVAGISHELCEAYSTRHKQIVEHVAKHGGNTRDAWLATRKDKDEPPFEELSEAWKRSLDEHRKKDVRMFNETTDLLGLESKVEPRSDHEILAALHEREAVWRKEDLIAQLAREHVGSKDIAGILQEADDFIARNDLVRIRPEHQVEGEMKSTARRFVEDRYAARWWVDGLEQAMVTRAHEMEGNYFARTPADKTEQGIQEFEKEHGFLMSDEQRHAVHHLANAAGIGILEGRAGTGKTTTTDALVKALHADNRYVIGCAPSWDAARKLEAETAVKSVSVARLLAELESDRRRLQDRDVVIVDEASMIGTADLSKLVHECHHAGAKLILEGDSQQLQAVSAGGGFRMLAGEVGKAELTEIRRQRKDYDRETVDAFYEDADKPLRSYDEQLQMSKAIFQRLESNNQIDVANTKQEAIKTLVEDWIASPTPLREKIVITGTKEDTRQLNGMLRDYLKKQGVVAETGIQVDNVSQGKRGELEVARGDRLRMGDREDYLGVINGTVVVVSDVYRDDKGHIIILGAIDSDIAKENGRGVAIDTTEFNRFNYAYAGTTHKSQGQTKEECYHLVHAGMADKHSSLVAASRARGSYQMYGAAGDIDALAERLGLDRLRVNALEQGRAKGERAPSEKELLEQARAASEILRERREREYHSH